MLDSLLSVLAPHNCLACGKEGALWCDRCRGSAPLAAERCYRCHALSPNGRTCPRCQRVSNLYSVQAATRYESVPKQLVWRLKFERARAGAAEAAAIMVTRLQLPEGAILTHVPTSTTRVRQRGYDQSLLIAQKLAHLTDKRHGTLLLRLGKQQQHTATRSQRLSQLGQAFVVVKPLSAPERHVLLVDDVITTGATLEAAARVLKAAGAKRVSAVVFAQA